MLSAKINRASLALSELAGTIPAESWNFVKTIQAELRDAANMARNVENTIPRALVAPRAASSPPRLRVVTPIRQA